MKKIIAVILLLLGLGAAAFMPTGANLSKLAPDMEDMKDMEDMEQDKVEREECE